MNKKVAFILALIICFVGIILVSSYGVVPENLLAKVYINKLEFVGKNVNVVTDKKGGSYKTYEFDFSVKNNTLDLSNIINFEPYDATDISLIYTTDKTKEQVTITSTGWLTIYDFSMMQFEVTITARDAGKKTDKLVIFKPSSNVTRYDGDPFKDLFK